MMQYATSPGDTVYYPIPRGLFPHYLTVQVSAEGMPVTVHKTFRIGVTGEGFLHMETAERPPAKELHSR